MHCHSYHGYKRDLPGSINSTLQPYDSPNLSNALLFKMIPYGDERLSVDSNSESLKQLLDTYTQHNVLNKVMLIKLRCCKLKILGVFVCFLFFFISFHTYL